MVHRNDTLSLQQAVALGPPTVVVSPGPGMPRHAGITVPLIRAMAGRCLVLGMCLGHQDGIAEAFGGRGSAWSPKPNGHNGVGERRPLEGA